MATAARLARSLKDWLKKSAKIGDRGECNVAYRRREPEKEPLYRILAGHLETFLQQALSRNGAAVGARPFRAGLPRMRPPGAGAPVGAQLSVRDALPPRLRRRVGLEGTGGVSARGGRLVSTSGAGHGP